MDVILTQLLALHSLEAPTWLLILLGIHIIAKVIVVLTPTPKDDEIYDKYYKWLERFALIVLRAKEPPSDGGNRTPNS